MPPHKTKGGETSGNIHERSAEASTADPNTQLQVSHDSNNPAPISFTEDNMDIDTMKKIIEIPTTEALASMGRQQEVDALSKTQSVLTLTSLESSARIDIKPEEKKRKSHLQLKLKPFLEEEAKGFPLLAAPPANEQTANQ